MRPIFRDRHDFSAGGTLTSQTIEALDASAALVIIVSPDAAMSGPVNEEVRLFKWRHPDRPVIPLIAERAIGDIEATCFPPALRFEVTADGIVTSTPTHPIGADLRERGGDGRDLALAKVVARLIGLPSDDVFRRAERERRRQARLRSSIIAAMVLLMSVGGFFAWDSQQSKTRIAEVDAVIASV